MPKRTLQKSKRRKARVSGFRGRMKSKNGKRTIKNRREKGRKKLAS